MEERFSEEVCLKVGNYVYRLIDPRNGETFYVGKGKNNRVFDHARGVVFDSADNTELMDIKLDRIKAIQGAGLKVLYVIHRHEIHVDAIFEVEAALIDAYPGLTNIQGGHGSSDRGPMNHLEIIDKYNLPEFPSSPTDALLLINIAKLEDKFDQDVIYDLVRYCWRLNVERARKAKYVVAVCRGVAVGVFTAEKWMSATPENFPDIPFAKVKDESQRFGFEGHKAPKEIWDIYVGKRGRQIIEQKLKHVQNPIRFYNC
ncbi:hypothetical protein [Bartonella sp. HY038]|uniref:LEM-3-like GIY-YIG domain-containing protein n=1 Tax=Bartonella sp. HY038 TaxID=2759660 RepID=UPI0015FA491A|nr:hypothetical protein [Bartonella sp. HY038]